MEILVHPKCFAAPWKWEENLISVLLLIIWHHITTYINSLLRPLPFSAKAKLIWATRLYCWHTWICLFVFTRQLFHEANTFLNAKLENICEFKGTEVSFESLFSSGMIENNLSMDKSSKEEITALDFTILKITKQ